MTWYELVAIASAMLAGWAGKLFGQRQDVGGDLPMQKATAPGAALFAAGFAVTMCAVLVGVKILRRVGAGSPPRKSLFAPPATFTPPDRDDATGPLPGKTGPMSRTDEDNQHCFLPPSQS